MKTANVIGSLALGTFLLAGSANASVTSGYRFMVTTNDGIGLPSGVYDTTADCNSARNDYIRYTPSSNYRSVGSCQWVD